MLILTKFRLILNSALSLKYPDVIQKTKRKRKNSSELNDLRKLNEKLMLPRYSEDY